MRFRAAELAAALGSELGATGDLERLCRVARLEDVVDAYLPDAG